MGRTFNQIKNSVLGKDFDVNNYSKSKNKGRTFEEIKSDVMSGKTDFSLVKTELEKRIRFDTFESDLSSMGKALGDTYGGWQSPEALAANRSSAENMQTRLSAYKDYQRLFGKDATSIKNTEMLQNDVRKALDGWEDLSKTYGQYKDAESYTRETTKLGELGAMTSSDIQKKMDELEKNKETDEEYFNRRSKEEIDRLTKEGYSGPIGATADDIALRETKERPDINIAYTTVGGENITWKSLYDQKKQKEESDALYKKISSMDDFEKYKTEGANIKNPTYDEANAWFGKKDIGNVVEYANANKDMIGLSNAYGSFGDDKVYYTTMTSQERDIYNYHLGRERAGLAEEGTADAYLESIGGILKDRHENNVISALTEYTEQSPLNAVLGSGISVWQNLGAGVEWLADSGKYLITGELDDNFSAKSSSAIRSTVSQNVDWEIGNWDAFDFVYNTGMSMADSVTSMALLGGAGGVALGLSAAAQGTNDALERGLDNKSAFWSGISAGVFEGLFESVSIGKFKALKDAPVDSFKTLVKEVGKSMLVNASEETLTEIANILYDNIANADLSQAQTKIRAYVSAGMSEEEAIRKVAVEQGLQIAEAGASGALMGFGFGAIGGTSAYHTNKTTGKSIKANERVSEVFDIASNPEIASAYEAYTNYANKGINADNITDAQLGSLYTSARADAMETLGSKKSTAEQKAQATGTLMELGIVDTENKVKKAAKETAKSFKVGEESDININDVKLEGDKFTVATENGKMAVEDATISKKESELLGIAKEYAKTEGEALANAFISQYDGETDIDAYTNQFNLTMAYAKGGVTFDTILNKRGELSKQAVKEIYKNTVIEANKKKKAEYQKLVKQMAGKKFYKGFVNDSVIDYNNTSAKGKVNWNDLTSKQRNAVTFIKGFAQATGMRVEFVANNPLFNGSYSRETNLLSINLDNMNDTMADKMVDAVIPAMSHETTHWMRKKSPEMWNHLNSIVFSTLVDHYNSNTEQALKDKADLLDRLGINYSEESLKSHNITEFDLVNKEYLRLVARDKKNGKPINKDALMDEAREEIIARACEDLLKMSQQGRKIFKSLSEAEQKSLFEKFKALVKDLLEWIDNALNAYDATSTEARIMREYKEQLQKASKVWDMMLEDSVNVNQALEKSGAYARDITSIGTRDLSELSEAVDTDGNKLFQYKAMVEDEEVYRKMLLEHKDIIGISNAQIKELFDMIDKAVDIISDNLEVLDYAWDTDINDRAFSPIKPNSDSLYQVSLDFSTLCRKRLLQQSIQRTLQNALDKNLSTEESIAIRDELLKVQEEGRKIEVACALCYVESARMKSPKQINKFLNNREAIIKEFFANRSGGSIKEKIANAELKVRKELQKANPSGLEGKNGVILDALTAPKSHMKMADADYVRDAGKKARASYKLTEHEQAELDSALKMSIDDFTSAKGLENLAKQHPDLFDAYTSHVRNATHSKGIENDTWWRAGDSESIGDALIAKMNAENGLRSQSWSDFQVIHLLDYIAATIELSTKGSKRQSYTKVPDYVKLLGNTGDMINISLIPERVFNGKLAYDGVEGMAYDIAKQLRDEYHETVGTVCIGINNEQIKMLLEDGTIDYVIPYHHSSMSKAVRKLMHIPAWETYQNYQGEKKLSDADAKARAKEYGVKLNKDNMYQKSPNFSEWFNLDEARQIAKLENENPSDMKAYKKYGKMYGGYMAMQNAANNYLKLCAERGLAPKFSSEKADFTHDANYWKLLIDRKMVDNVTGEIIEQKPIKPIFNEKHILEILNDELERYPQVKADQEYATRKVVQKFLSGDMKVDKSTLDALKSPIDNVAVVNILESSKEDNILHSDKDSEYLELATNPEQNEARLRELVDEAAKSAGYNVSGYHGTPNNDFTVFDKNRVGKGIDQYGAGFYFASNKDAARAYGARVIDSRISLNNPIKINGSSEEGANLIDGGYDYLLTEEQAYEVIRRLPNIYDAEESILGDYYDSYWEGGAEDWMIQDLASNEFNRNIGYLDSDLFRDYPNELHEALRDVVGYDGIEVTFDNGDKFYVAWFNNQMKSADPVTYDDNGNIIPLSQRFNAENEDIRYSEKYSDDFIDSTVKSFGIEKLGDYIHVQRQVLNTLVTENFFTDKENRKRVDINKASGMVIETNKSGIDETFNLKNFARIGKNKKITKLATIRMLPEIIEKGTIVDDNVPNQYVDSKNKRFAYIEYTCEVDGKEVTIRIDIKKSPQKNKFWVHRVWEKENVSNFPASTNEGTEAGHTKADINKTISHPERIVKELHSEKDSEGNTLTKEQIEYFKDSKVRDADGNLLVVYHGTPNGGFTEFKLPHYLSTLTSAQGAGYYFTDKANAKQYTKALNGKLGGKKQLYQVYLNITNPLEITQYSKGAISDDAFRRIMARGNYDWGKAHTDVEKRLQFSITDADRLMEMVRVFNGDEILTVMKEELGYDGVRFTDKYGDIWVAWSKEQIKNIDNTNPTESPDIRYSEKDDTSVYELMGENERLKKENERFKADFERLQERLKIERQITHGNYFNENQLGAVAGHLRNIAKSSYDKVTLMRNLKDVYSYIAQSSELTWEEVFEKCYRVAHNMLEESKPITMTDEYTKGILRDVRNTKISLSEAQKSEAKYIFGKNWNRNFFGRITITDNGVPLESIWQEWAGLYPDFFDADISDVNMPERLYDILNDLQDASEIVMQYNEEEQTRWLAHEIYNQYWNVSNIKSTADKYDKKIKLLNFEHRKAMAEFRSAYEDRVEKQRLVDDMYYRRKMSEQKGKFNAELVAQRKEAQERQRKLVKELRDRKDEQIAIAKQHGRDMMDKYKDNAERKTRIQSITSNALSLNEMLIKNSKDKHIPEILKEPVAAMLQALDFSSKRLLEKGEPTQKDISLSKSLSKVKDMMLKASNAHNDLVELYGHGLDEEIERMIDSVDDIRNKVGDNEFILNRMSAEDLQTLDKMVKTIRHAVNKLNKFHTVNHAKGIANLSKESVEYLDSLGKGKIYDGLKGKARKLLDWGNALPYYVFKRFGSGGTKVYEALQDGWDKFAFNVKKIIDYANEAYTSEEVKKWSEEVKTFKVLIPASELDMASGDYTPQYQEVQLTVPQIMSMYCLSKREQAKKHLFQGGIRVADFKTKKGEIVSQSDGIIFTEKDVSAILNSLTDRQKAVADKLQEFMNTVCADWGNDVSMARFGYKAFGEENYFPIQSDKNNLAVNDETEQPNSLFKLLNMAFTKSTIENANNRIVISDIFDVFAQHTSDMAKYNALALPVLDSFKWYNFTEKQDVAEGTFKTKGVKQSIEKAFGKDGQSYFTTFLKDINGTQEVSRDTLGKGFFKNAKIASVGANIRVVLLQPTSYVRASAVIDNKYLLKALRYKPKTKKAEEHCGIALWKSMGYYDTNVQRGVEEQIKHDGTWKDKAVEWSMKGAEVADKITWGYLWNACELEVRDTRKDLRVGSKEFYDAVSKRLREVIYSTQVVDSTMTRSQMMRSGDWRDKMLTSFASEPTLSYNMLQDAYMEYALDARRMGKAEAIKKNAKHIGRVVYAYTMTNAVAALVESAFDAYRDDDDEEMDMIEFMKLYFKNFALDMSIGNKIPYVKDLYSILQGYSSSRMDTQWAQYFINAMNAKTPSKRVSYGLRFISQISGLPFYNLYRDTMATLNKLDLFTEEDLNEMFEDFLD